MMMERMHKILSVGLGLTLFWLGSSAHAYTDEPLKPEEPAPKAPPVELVNASECYSCHANIEEFHGTGRHATVNCSYCHDAVEHLEKADEEISVPVQ
jgi:hypothetical protein